MGPKAKKSARKTKKITKAERLRKLQEEEERQQKEEEEARVKHEKEEMERLERQRIDREKWQQLEAKDLERRNEELEELYLLEGCFPEAEKLKQDTRWLSQWNHYIQCDGSPDPSIAPEINTFISLWKEETNETLEDVIAKSKLVLNLIEKLRLLLLQMPSYGLEDKTIKQYQGSILELQELLHLKFNTATEILLRQASTLVDLDSGNMEKVIQDENVTLYVWANLKKNPRYRSVRFSETQIGFEIPRILATSNVAVRLLHTHYDHVTPLRPVSTSLQGRTATVTDFVQDKVKNVEAEISKELQEEYKPLECESVSLREEGTAVEEGDTAVQMEPELFPHPTGMCVDASAPVLRHPSKTEKVHMKSAKAEAEEPRSNANVLDIPPVPEETSICSYSFDVSVERGGFRILPHHHLELEPILLLRGKSSVQEESKATKCELEMKLLSETVLAAQLLLIENANDKPSFFGDNEVDLCQFTALGGVYHLDIFELPPQCKPMKGWMIVEILKEGLQKYIYPPESTEDFETENAFPPIEVTLEVQENVIFFEDPMVARWDAEGEQWQTDGISNVSYKSEERLITFSLETFGPVTLIQDAHINMPFQSWELRPLDVNKVLLTVTTVFTEIEIQIKEDLCMLASIKLDNKKHSPVLEGRWMTPICFILALKETGLNIFPTRHSHFYVVINNKDPLVELKAYRQLALLSSAFAFGWSKWNVVCGSNKVIVQLREHLTEEEPVPDPDWTLLMFNGDRAQRLNINENSETFSEALKEETEFHSNLYHMVKDFASKDAMERIRSSRCQFIDSVCHMLLSTRLLSYS